MTLHTELLTIRSLIDTPEKWTKETFARSKNGRPVLYGSSDATCFCLVGAVDRARASGGAYAVLARAIGHWAFSRWNDAPERTHTDILEALDRAIEMAGEGE